MLTTPCSPMTCRAEMERNLTRERTRSAMAVKKANGQRMGSTPYGYDLADVGPPACIPRPTRPICYPPSRPTNGVLLCVQGVNTPVAECRY